MTDSIARAYVVGTCDTKSEELHYVRDLLRRAGVPALLVDVGTRSVDGGADIGPGEIAALHPDGGATIIEE